MQCKLEHSGLDMTNRYVQLASEQMAAIQERVAPMDKIDVYECQSKRVQKPR